MSLRIEHTIFGHAHGYHDGPMDDSLPVFLSLTICTNKKKHSIRQPQDWTCASRHDAQSEKSGILVT